LKPSSAKSKGRRLQQWVAKQISIVTGIKCGKDCDIESREMGQAGCDVKLYGPAAEMYPFAIETKNAERWDVHSAVKQARSNAKPGQDWQVFLKRNGQKPVVVMDAEAWFDFWEQYLKFTW